MTSFKEPTRDGSSSIYHLNSPSRYEAGANSFQFPEATPDHTRQLDTGYRFNLFNWTQVTSEEKVRHASLSVPAENVVYNKSVATISAEQVTERTFLQKEGNWVMDLNKTPTTQTIPIRHGHRQKVIFEGKPKSTPKGPPVVKRKYVRKNNLTQTEGGSTSKEQPSGRRKYVRKNELTSPKSKESLKFDLGKEQSLEDSGEPGIQASLNAMVRSMRNCANHLLSEVEAGQQKEKNIVNGDQIISNTTGNMSLVPYKGLNIGKKQFLPKVNHDPETNRAWKLLMGKEVSEGNEAEDEIREKWWEAERKVFQGRVECFNARMHLIQEDRRFTKWKGSVVNSVIGVFLTQNVADHLSSSAYMSLAAKFPIIEESQILAWFQGEPSVIVGEPDVPADSENLNHWFPDEDLSWLQPNSCISSTPVLHEDQTEAFEKWWNKSIIQNSVDQYMPTNGGAKFTYADAFLGTTFYPGNEIRPTIPEKATGDFNVIEIEKTYFLSPEWSAVHTGAPSSKEQSADATKKRRKQRCTDALDSMDYEALRKAHVKEIAETIKNRGFHNLLATRIKDFLDRLVSEHGAMDLEWLRDAPQDKAKDYLLSIEGLGLKSTECVRLLTLHHIAFPVDTNVARIAVRLGWVPLQPLPESLHLHLLEEYPVLDSIQKYLWPRLCKLDQPTLYELHYQMITFGKVFCTKIKPNCNACPMRGECRHFASAFASSRLALPGLEERRIVTSTVVEMKEIPSTYNKNFIRSSEPIVEEPESPEPERNDITESDMEDTFYQDSDDIPTIKLNLKEFTQNLHSYMQGNMELQGCDLSKALVALTPDVASIPTAKLKSMSRLRTVHQVYELPDSHPLLEKMNRREQDDPSPYLLAIWIPGETTSTTQLPERNCGSQDTSSLCNQSACLSCNSIREANAQIVLGTLLVPCRTAMMGSFPLNGTYFQVNEMFADHESSLNPISVPRSMLWYLRRKTVYFGTSVSSIFRGMSTDEIQQCFWRGFVCVRGFDQKTRTARPLIARLHFPKSKPVNTKDKIKKSKQIGEEQGQW